MNLVLHPRNKDLYKPIAEKVLSKMTDEIIYHNGKLFIDKDSGHLYFESRVQLVASEFVKKENKKLVNKNQIKKMSISEHLVD